MFHIWPGFLAIVVCTLSFAYAKRRRDLGCPVTAGERLWLVLLIPAVCFPALTLPSIDSPVSMETMSTSERITAALVVIGLGFMPLAIGLCFSTALRSARRYVALTRAEAEADTPGDRR